MERHLTWTVDKSQEGKRLIDWLREKGCSKQVLSVIKNHEGSLLNNGEKPYFRDPLQAGDVVELTAARAGYQYHCAGSAGIFCYI